MLTKVKTGLILPGGVKAKKPSLTLTGPRTLHDYRTTGAAGKIVR